MQVERREMEARTIAVKIAAATSLLFSVLFTCGLCAQAQSQQAGPAAGIPAPHAGAEKMQDSLDRMKDHLAELVRLKQRGARLGGD